MGQSNLSGGAAACGAARLGDESRAARACWRASRVQGLLVVCAGTAFFWAAQFAAGVQKGERVELRADTVTAVRFELIGASGKRAALPCPGARGGARMTFYNEKGVRRLGVGIAEGDAGPDLMLYDRGGEPRLSAAVPTAMGAPVVRLLPDATAGPGVWLNADWGGASASLTSKSDGGRLSMSLGVFGFPLMGLTAPGGKCGTSLTMDRDHQWIMLGQGKRRPAGLGLHADGSPVLQLQDRSGKVSSSMTLRANGEAAFDRLAP